MPSRVSHPVWSMRAQHSIATLHSRCSRMYNAFSALCMLIFETYVPDWGMVETKPSWPKRTSASRTGVRPNPSDSSSRRAESFWPGASLQRMMS